MNRDIFEGKWHEIKGKVKEKWGKLTDDDISKINGKYDQLAGRLQQRYGYAKDQAEREIKSWEFESDVFSSEKRREKPKFNRSSDTREDDYKSGKRKVG